MFILRGIITALPFGYMAFIWYLSSYPSDAIINTGVSFDGTLKEMLHLVEFAGLYGLWILVFLSFGKLNESTCKLAILLAIGYGFVDEMHQFFIPARSATVIDLVKDSIGVLVVHMILKRIYFASPRSKVAAPLHWMEQKLTR